MITVSIEQMLYLLYAKVNAKQGTVTKSVVKQCLPKEWEAQAEAIYSSLETQELINRTNKDGKPTKRVGRFAITIKGVNTLLNSLSTTSYTFRSSKGPKVLNFLLSSFQEFSQALPVEKKSNEMQFEEFVEHFKDIYFEKRKQQELKGVVAIHSQEICEDFIKTYNINKETLVRYFNLLKETGKIFAVNEKGHELIQWVE